MARADSFLTGLPAARYIRPVIINGPASNQKTEASVLATFDWCITLTRYVFSNKGNILVVLPKRLLLFWCL